LKRSNFAQERDRRLDDKRAIAGSGNVFIDLGFDDVEARMMAFRVQLTFRLRERQQAKATRTSKS
jgi:hypothetical protein